MLLALKVVRGYRGHEVKDTKVFISGQKRGVTRSIKKALKRRSAIEPEIQNYFRFDGVFYQTGAISCFKPGLMSGLKRYYSG